MVETKLIEVYVLFESGGNLKLKLTSNEYSKVLDAMIDKPNRCLVLNTNEMGEVIINLDKVNFIQCFK